MAYEQGRGVQAHDGGDVEDYMEPLPRTDATSAAIDALEFAVTRGRVVVVDVDAVLLARPLTREVLHLLFHCGLIGPVRFLRSRRRARRSAARKEAPSARYLEGVCRDDFVRLVAELAADLGDNAEPAMLETIASHVEACDFVILRTDAPQEIVDSLVHEIGAHRGIGSRPEVHDGLYTGTLIAQVPEEVRWP